MNELKLSKLTIEILKKYSDIHQSIRINAGNELRAHSPTESVYAICEIEETFPRDWYCYELRSFISALSIVDSPTIDFSDPDFVSITDEKKQFNVAFYDSEESLIKSHFDGSPNFDDFEIKLNMTDSYMQKVLNASSVLKLPSIGFVSDGKKVYLTAFDGSAKPSDSNKYSILLGEGNGDSYRMFMKSSEFSKLLEGNYDVSITSKGIALFESKDISMKVIISLDNNSKYEG
jgi:hypothetical protein